MLFCTGLWIYYLVFCEVFRTFWDNSVSLLLDKGPFSLVSYFLNKCTWKISTRQSGSSHHYPDKPLTARVQTLTSSRSQVRAVCNPRLYQFVWIYFLLFQIFSTSTQWSEGCAVNMDSVGAAAPFWSPAAKGHVEELQLASEHTQTNSKQCIKKRSYKRAIRRAEMHGFTLYKGRLRTATQLGTVYKGTVQNVPQKPNVTQTQKMKRKRITCFNWNCSGLSPSGWDFMQQWLACQRLDVITLQETHWRHTSEWLTEHYYAMHSGTSDGRAGLLTLINKDICTMHDLSWREISPGRIMHVRVHGRDRDLDFVNVYQHVHARDRMDARLQQTLLTSFPKRNPLTVLGDWNTSLRQSSTAVGLDTYQWRQNRCGGPKHADSHFLHNILQQFDLVSVNTWHAHLGPTYIFGEQTSRIDFAICRRCHSDATSKQVQYLSDFPLICKSGAYHVPQLVSLLKVWHPNYADTSMGWTRAQRLELHRQWTQNPSAAENLQQDIQHTITNHPLDGNRLEHVHQALNSFPAPQIHKKHAEICRFDITPFQLFQAHSQHLRDLRQPTLSNLFKAWFHIHHRQQARKQMRKTSARARKVRLQRIFQAAGRAEAAKDHFRMYQAIRELAPKQPYRRVQIRDTDGNILNPSDAADRIRDWLAELYHDNQAESVCPSFSWPFSAVELEQGLLDLPAVKALAPGYAPAPYWRCAAEEISLYLQEYFCLSSEQRVLPRSWNIGSLCLLPKHTRRSHLPQGLRPITLLEPCGKALLGTLASHLFDHIGDVLCSVPQYAYLPGRGTEEALVRIFNHCADVRTLCNSRRHPLQQLAQGSQPSSLGGGLLVTLDLSKAFDMVPRGRLFRCLSDLGVRTFCLIFCMPYTATPVTHSNIVARPEAWTPPGASDKVAKLLRPYGQHMPLVFFLKFVNTQMIIGCMTA